MLIDMDEWGQLATLRLLTVYARRSFPVRTVRKKIAKKTDKEGENFYSDEEGEESGELEQVLDPDLELLLKACPPLLMSRNSAVSWKATIWTTEIDSFPGHRCCSSHLSSPCSSIIYHSSCRASMFPSPSTHRNPVPWLGKHCRRNASIPIHICSLRNTLPCQLNRSPAYMAPQT